MSWLVVVGFGIDTLVLTVIAVERRGWPWQLAALPLIVIGLAVGLPIGQAIGH